MGGEGRRRSRPIAARRPAEVHARDGLDRGANRRLAGRQALDDGGDRERQLGIAVANAPGETAARAQLRSIPSSWRLLGRPGRSEIMKPLRCEAAASKAPSVRSEPDDVREGRSRLARKDRERDGIGVGGLDGA